MKSSHDVKLPLPFAVDTLDDSLKLGFKCCMECISEMAISSTPERDRESY